jgi:hypothetical protein
MLFALAASVMTSMPARSQSKSLPIYLLVEHLCAFFWVAACRWHRSEQLRRLWANGE